MLDDIIIKKLQIIFVINKKTYNNKSKKDFIDKNIKNLSYNKLQLIIEKIFKNIKENDDNVILKNKISKFTIPVVIDLGKIIINNNFNIFNTEFEKKIYYQLNICLRSIFSNHLAIHNNIDNNYDSSFIIDIFSRLKNENDIKLLEKTINIKEFYDVLLKNSNKIKDFWVKVGQNDKATDYILEKIPEYNIITTFNILYGLDYSIINKLKNEIFNYKEYLYLSKIKINQIENIIKKELLKNYHLKYFNIYELTINLL